MKRRLLTMVIMPCFLFCVTACGSYYKVKDLNTEKIYYTKQIDQEKSGAVKFEDPRSKSILTIQNSEVTEINKDEFKANTAQKK
nr:hypothetical protein [uncultured Desulfobacter sp.]